MDDVLIPGDGDVAGPEQRSECEPERVAEGKVVDVLLDGWRSADCAPAGFGPPVDGEEDERNGQEDGANGGPNLRGQRRHEGQESGLLLHRLLDHDTDAQLHERSAEIDDALAGRRYGDGPQSNVRLLISDTTPAHRCYLPIPKRRRHLPRTIS